MHICDQRGVLILHFVTSGGAGDGEVGKGKERGGCSGVVERQRPRVGRSKGAALWSGYGWNRPTSRAATRLPAHSNPLEDMRRHHQGWNAVKGTALYGVVHTYKILNK